MLPGAPGGIHRRELGRFKAFFYDFGPGGRGPSGSNQARKSAGLRGGILQLGVRGGSGGFEGVRGGIPRWILRKLSSRPVFSDPKNATKIPPSKIQTCPTTVL